MMRSRWLKCLPPALLLANLGGCGGNDQQEVAQWMSDVKRETKIVTLKIDEPKKFTPFVYGGADAVDPYNPIKLSVALAKMQAKSSGALKPNLDRRREVLEDYPLDTVKMVGTLQKPGLSYALLQVDKAVFQIKVGNYVGQNFGVVTKVSETEVELKELVQDASGEWTERQAKLELQGNK
ncbi:pilus assembly protein PilP [Herminiimonas sp. CN]|uniref:pilus assembly protein PilP n=1 Tax=Herminiimonas sp. CN TaxID=1349818 RepID=UPI000473161F|nr:pilus assembly protein PilP [Herminiimonas sp. CN]